MTRELELEGGIYMRCRGFMDTKFSINVFLEPTRLDFQLSFCYIFLYEHKCILVYLGVFYSV